MLLFLTLEKALLRSVGPKMSAWPRPLRNSALNVARSEADVRW